MFVATSFPCEAWLSLLDSNALEILVMPLEITGVDDDPEFYRCSDTDAPIHRDFLCLSQAEAIQTRYKGYHFRSRLEARWAVFFDTLGYKWEYEPEGFVLPTGAKYLPDFHIKGVDTSGEPFDFWCEVKGDIAALTETDNSKIDTFGYQLAAGGKSVLFVLVGAPEPKRYEVVARENHWLWSERKRPWFGDIEPQTRSRNPFSELMAACDAARDARFEHGQSGATT